VVHACIHPVNMPELGRFWATAARIAPLLAHNGMLIAIYQGNCKYRVIMLILQISS